MLICWLIGDLWYYWNTDFKLILKVIAYKMKKFLSKLINKDKTWFMQGREILQNIRKMLDIIQYAKEEQVKVIIVSLDFEKCFNKIEHSVLIGILKAFNFGDNFISWMKILFTEFQVCTTNYGAISKWFTTPRGLHQGVLSSPDYFILTGELILSLIHNNLAVEGVVVNNEENKLSQFTDDMDSFLLFKQKVLQEAINMLDYYEQQTRLCINYEKTTIYWIDSARKSYVKLYVNKQLHWSDKPINVLGVLVSHKPKELSMLNYTKTIVKVWNTCNLWKMIDLSLMGKIQVINALIGSLFVYKMTVLPNAPGKVIQEVESIIKDFIWNGKRAKIKPEILQTNKDNGGLGLIDLTAQQKVLKTQWMYCITRYPFI